MREQFNNKKKDVTGANRLDQFRIFKIYPNQPGAYFNGEYCLLIDKYLSDNKTIENYDKYVVTRNSTGMIDDIKKK